MDKVGISSASWQSVVTSARTKVASISDIQVTKIGKNTLNRMKAFETLQEQAKEILSDYKDFEMERTSQMITVGEKIVADDKAMAGQFDKNTANVRFQ
ncbi:type VII secretion protein [Streptococcus azizii]|uniref:Type VII secretion protein n=1 Tax=Streptococcus azizii TaxID=1579424 RepID=A0AB36JMC3_9STRE|nr:MULTISPECIES: type VII secretion protein [Streptococcus]MBF0776994.1 type VII secretion protein [Streptococcus sp. 19428wD3_AN2]ONK25973.1 type VII secretion protein [Streptococcus azizii]ONK26119.1 type VII secretion protein [Streptococcus azizii]ONK26370.1 type VII secretion protein [Streptococcus azizii]TFU81930.1 type VII secretion protein [Streptococcus sp. AN2]